MTCYKDLVAMLRAKDTPDEDVDSYVEWAFDALEKSNPHAYRDIMDKMENKAYELSYGESEAIVKRMRPKGQVWSMDRIKEFLQPKGITTDICKWYLVMNMCYNDYYNTAKVYGLQNETDFYYYLARDFIEDIDAEPHKVAKYFSA